MAKNKSRLIVVIVSLLAIALSVFVAVYSPSDVSAHNHDGKVLSHFGFGRDANRTAVTSCNQHGSGTYCGTASGYVDTGGHAFSFSGAYCADCEALGVSFCGCPWPNHASTSHGAYLRGDGLVLLDTHIWGQDLRTNNQSTDLQWDEYNYRDVLVYAEQGDNGTTNITGHPLNDLFYNYSGNSVPYSHTTSINQYSDSTVVKGITWKIRETIHYQQSITGAQWEYAGRSYDIVGSWENSKQINYNADTPTLEQVMYCPLNLNRQSWIQSGDELFSTLGSTQKIDASVTNNSNQDLGTEPIDTLDINNDSNFQLKFNNNNFGLGTDVDWDNEPKHSVPTDSTMGEYANGYNKGGDGPDKSFKYNVWMNGTVSDISSGGNLSSLVSGYFNTEYPASGTNQFQLSLKSWRSSPSALDFSARAIYNGTFHLTNKTKGTTYNNWWNITYNQGKYYEYGTSYSGMITTGGVTTPTISGKLAGHSPSASVNDAGGTCSVRTNGVDQRGLYVNLMQNTFEQPLLRGDWRVRTMAGDIN